MSECNLLVKEFLNITCEEIKAKRVHKQIVNELSDHIEEQTQYYIKQGFDELTATKKALEQMGNPTIVGKELNKAHQPKTEWSIIVLTFTLVIIGGFIQYFVSRANSYNSHAFFRFLIYAPIGLIAFFCAYFFDYTIIKIYSKLLYSALFISTIIGFVFINRINGTYLYVYYSAILFIPIFAGIVYSLREKGYFGIILCGILYGGVAILCLFSVRTIAFLLLSISCLAILTFAINKGYFKCNKRIGLSIIYTPIFLILILSVYYILSAGHRRERFATMFNPENDPMGAGYLSLLIRELVGNSQPFGLSQLKGSLANMKAELILPAYNTDFILTFVFARFGYIFGVIIIALFIVFLARIFTSVLKQKNKFGVLISFSACLAITIQFALYTLSNLGIIATFSVTLPFISYGGLGFITNMLLIGIVLSVYRNSNIIMESL